MPTHAYQMVAADLRRRIYGGEFPPGSRLPTRAQLREEYERSDQVIGWAMRILHAEGLIETLHGVAVQVVRTLPPRAEESG